MPGATIISPGPGARLRADGSIPFRVDDPDFTKVTLAIGTIAFQHRDAKGFSRAGEYSFNYGSMANGQIFLFALDKLLGYPAGVTVGTELFSDRRSRPAGERLPRYPGHSR